MKDLTIGEVARRARMHASAIRYYESVGLLPPPKRVNGRRRYDRSVVQRLGLIQFARQAGFHIGELQVLFAESIDAPVSQRWQTLISEKVAEMDALIEHSQAIKRRLLEAPACQCAHVDECATALSEQAERGMHSSCQSM